MESASNYRPLLTSNLSQISVTTSIQSTPSELAQSISSKSSNDTPPKSPSTPLSSMSDKFSLPADPTGWGIDVKPGRPEPDDWLHNPDPRRDRKTDKQTDFMNGRGIANLGCLFLLALILLGMFVAYPLTSFFLSKNQTNKGGFNLGGINASGQVPEMPGGFGLIDPDTPAELYTKASYTNKGDMQLVFSDEFNTDGRTFWPGDDPYWEAVDLHYWGTNNMEWYSPEAITTANGSLQIALSEKKTHDLNYQGGMMSTWNKFCYTGGLMEAAITLPGANNVMGLWPALWAMGNLGRAGYGATLEGTWPYTYDSCDVGTVGNQTLNGLPVQATINGDASYNGALSYQGGQRLSRCTCPGESHPGPIHADGTYVGRAAPEIDAFEAQVANEEGEVSQSGQWAPFNYAYDWFNNTDTLTIYNKTGTQQNGYKGGVFQQATSAVTKTNQQCYQLSKNACFAIYGFEYIPGFDDAYITWINDGKAAWTMTAAGMAADTRVEIGPRPVPQEPLYIIMNLGMSSNFGTVDLEHLIFPAVMSVDWVRVYQFPDSINIGCDPSDFPTKTYIEQYAEAYSNPNFTTWEDDYKQPMPKNSFLGQC